MSDRDVRLGPVDLHLLAEGTHARLFEKLGAQVTVRDGQKGTQFAVWAPNAETIDVMGDWNGWRPGANADAVAGAVGRVAGVRAGGRAGAPLQVHIRSRHGGYTVDKADPFAFASEVPPATASVIASMDYALERRRLDARAGASATRWTRRCRSTRCTSARGCADPEHPDRVLELSRAGAAPDRARAAHAASRTSS